MRTIEDVRERKRTLVSAIVARPGMFGDARAAFLLVTDALRDLCWLDDRDDADSEWAALRARYDSYGVPGVVNWFADPRDLRGADLVASVVAEVAWRLGYLAIEREVDPNDWARLRLDEPDRWSSKDWTQSNLEPMLPVPSLRVGNGAWGCAVWCFAPVDRRQWVYFDFETTYRTRPNPGLREVRTPAPKARDGIIWTPLGRSLRAGS